MSLAADPNKYNVLHVGLCPFAPVRFATADTDERPEWLAIRIRDLSFSDGPALRSLLLRGWRGRPSVQLSLGAYRNTQNIPVAPGHLEALVPLLSL